MLVTVDNNIDTLYVLIYCSTVSLLSKIKILILDNR